MKFRVIVSLVLGMAACARSQDGATTSTSSAPTTTGAAPCGTLGGKCKVEGAMCSPAPVGTGWAHSLRCVSGKWQELEIAPLPTPASSL